MVTLSTRAAFIWTLSRKSDIRKLKNGGEIGKKEFYGNKPSHSKSKMADRRFQTAKPPNILIHCEPIRMESLKSAILNCVLDDIFTIYKLEQPENNLLWMDNCAVLVIDTNNMTEELICNVNRFWMNGGKVLAFCPKMIRSVFNENAEILITNDEFISVCTPEKDENVNVTLNSPIFKMGHCSEGIKADVLLHSMDGKVPVFILTKNNSKDASDGAAILSQARFDYHLETSLFSYLLKNLDIECKSSNGHLEEVTLEHLYLVASTQDCRNKFVDFIKPHLKEGNVMAGHQQQMKIFLEDDVSSVARSTKEMLVVIASPKEPADMSFNRTLYFDSLITKHLGRVVLFSEITTSTMDIVNRDGLPHGLVCVARRQTKGKGRSGNLWLSPEGCAMFSAVLIFTRNSKIVGHLPMLQHIVALSVVEAIRNLPGYHDLDVRIKWPNDIYFGSRVKLGGVIVSSTMNSNNVICTIGCGINVSNAAPTICLNELMASLSVSPTESVILSTEQVIALTLNHLERNLEAFEVKGPAAILPSYYDKWLHSGQEVTLSGPLTSEGTPTKAKVVGLDDFGFLTVLLEGSNVIQSVQPDGNTFDMTRNLVLVKTT